MAPPLAALAKEHEGGARRLSAERFEMGKSCGPRHLLKMLENVESMFLLEVLDGFWADS